MYDFSRYESYISYIFVIYLLNPLSIIINRYLSATESWSLPKHENLTTCKKEILWKRGEIVPLFHNIFYISNLKSPVTHVFVKCGYSNYFFPPFCKSDNYVEVRISRSISESPMEFEKKKVDCKICLLFYLLNPLSRISI